ncbi:MAG: MCP four helix bundle domain-containing protein [Spirochaetales bacterium]|nr:MCP four helix bundle domain-containing protein [Spirochaetales bacterium]
MASPGVTIRTKILGILTLLLLAMALVAGFSVYRVSGVARELHTVANHYLPILRSIESIEDHALEQELHYTRLIRLHEMRGAPTVLREREERQFLERGRAVDRELESTIALLETARQITAVPIDRGGDGAFTPDGSRDRPRAYAVRIPRARDPRSHRAKTRYGSPHGVGA